MFIKRVIDLRKDIEVEVIVVVRILSLIVIDEVSFIDFELVKSNEVL